MEAVREVKHGKPYSLLHKAINDPDILWEALEARELVELLEKENLVIYKYTPILTGEELGEDADLGIGKYYAWQIPVYRDAIKTSTTGNLASNKATHITIRAPSSPPRSPTPNMYGCAKPY